MEYSGYIQGEGGAPVAGYFTIVSAIGEVLAGPTNIDPAELFVINAGPGEMVVFGSPGYESAVVPYPFAMPVVALKKSIPWLTIAAVVAAVYLYRKRSGKIGKLSTGDVVPIMLIVGGVLAFDIIKKILEGLGIWDDRDTKDLDGAASNPNSFWNPEYWKGFQHYSFALSEAAADGYAKKIYESFGAFNDCEECVIGIFKSLHTKANASFIAWAFQKKYNQDLLSFLRGGVWPQDRLSDSDVADINNFVNQLPNY